MNQNKPEKSSPTLKRTVIEWGSILSVILLLYITGLHTEVMGTLQRGLLATGLIKPDVPELVEDFPIIEGEFHFADENGRVTSLAQLDGQVVFMNVWATWCPPCIAEMPSIQSLYDQMSGNSSVKFVLVSMDEDFETAKRFMERRNFDMPIYHYRSRSRQDFESTMLPTTYVITKDGRLAMEKRGLAKYDTPEFIDFLGELSAL